MTFRTPKVCVLSFALVLSGCSSVGIRRPSQYANYSNTGATYNPAYAAPAPLVPSQPVVSTALLLFGGEGHRVFLGCINCSQYDSDSIFNEYGTYGSKYSDTSIWNPYGTYGSRYSDDSPWNPYASNPPVVVDHDGNFYGYFTANQFHPKRTTIRRLLMLLAAHTE
jgi:hypothetical protein